jgi:hypothetical protein
MTLAISKTISVKTNIKKEDDTSTQTEFDVDTKLSLLMKSLTEFYTNELYIEQIKNIIDQNSVVSLRILDWFITNYSKKHRTIIFSKKGSFDVYQNYKLQLKSFSKRQFDPFCRKNKIIFYYNENDYIETSCGQLCFFRWCFENDILSFVKNNLSIIEQDMKNSLKIKKANKETTSKSSESDSCKKRQPLSISASRSVSKQNVSYTVKFD